VMGVGSAAEWKEKVKAIGVDLKLDIQTSDSGTGPSDHTNFYVKGIPVLHFFTGIHGDYHRPSDTADKVNAAGGVRVVNMLAGVTDWLLDAPRLTYKKTKASSSGRGMGNGAYFGIMTDYADGEGLAITDVMADGPAEKAGLKAGDVITQWNDAAIKNVYDLTDRLREAKPGDEVKIKAKRGDKVVELTVKLGRRG